MPYPSISSSLSLMPGGSCKKMESFFGFSFKVHHNFFKMTAWGERYNGRLKNEDLDPQIFTISLWHGIPLQDHLSQAQWCPLSDNPEKGKCND